VCRVEGGGEAERRGDACELAAVLEPLGHHRVGQHGEDRAAREGQDERERARRGVLSST
jgi:hypothetical protein